MAGEDIGIGSMFSSFTGGFGSATTFIYYTVIALAIVSVVWMIVFYFMHNKKVILRKQTDGPDLVIITKGRTVRNIKEHYFKVWGKKIRLSAPPKEAISLTKRGKEVVEIELSDNNVARYIIKDKAGPQFRPYDSDDRMMHATELDKADARKRKGLGELLMQLAPMLAILAIFIVIVVFWEDVMKPMQAAGAAFEKTSKNLADVTTRLEELIEGGQVVSVQFQRSAAANVTVGQPPG